MPEPLDLDFWGRYASECNDTGELENALLQCMEELRATRSREVQLRAMEGIQRTAKMEALTRAERAEAAIADHDECAWSRRAWDALDALVDAKAAILRLQRWAVNGTYDAQHAASFNAALRGDHA